MAPMPGFLLIDWQFQEAEQNFQRSLDLDPANAIATNQMAVLQMNLGKFLQSEQLLKKAISIDPIRAAAYANLGYTLCGIWNVMTNQQGIS